MILSTAPGSSRFGEPPANKRMDQSWRGCRMVPGWHGRASQDRFPDARRATLVMRGR